MPLSQNEGKCNIYLLIEDNMQTEVVFIKIRLILKVKGFGTMKCSTAKYPPAPHRPIPPPLHPAPSNL